MIRLRHLRHPVRSARSLYSRVDLYLERGRAEREFRDVQRGARNHCWCGGSLKPFDAHPSYGTCVQCGCYVNCRPLLPRELQRLYSFEAYWHRRQKLKGHLPIESRTVNDRADGRLDCWLRLIEQHHPGKGRAIEVGCAHGVLLVELRARGYECIGVEPDERTAEWTRKNTGLDIRTGFFPDVSLPACDLFLTFDVIEHTLDPLAFLRGAAKLLTASGVVVLQTPIDREKNLAPPFGSMFVKTFDDLEHQFVFVDESMKRLAHAAGLEVKGQGRWQVGHELVVLKKPQFRTVENNARIFD